MSSSDVRASANRDIAGVYGIWSNVRELTRSLGPEKIDIFETLE